MLNFLHKACNPDGEQAQIIAKRMKERAIKKINELEYLLNKRLGTKLTERIKLSEINDFPKIQLKTILEEILFGTYQYKECQRYYEDLLDIGYGYFICKKQKEKTSGESNTKIIAFEISSRHRRSVVKYPTQKKNKYSRKRQFKRNYKVFIEYTPNIDSPVSIKGFFIFVNRNLKNFL